MVSGRSRRQARYRSSVLSLHVALAGRLDPVKPPSATTLYVAVSLELSVKPIVEVREEAAAAAAAAAAEALAVGVSRARLQEQCVQEHRRGS